MGIAFFNLGSILEIEDHGLNHFHEAFTWEGCSRAHYNINVAGRIILLILAYIFMMPCAIIYWIAKLFTY